MLSRILLFLFVAIGSFLGALATGFSGDAGPGVAFYVLGTCTLLFFVSGLALVFSTQSFRESFAGKVAWYGFFGVIGFIALAVVALRVYSAFHSA